MSFAVEAEALMRVPDDVICELYAILADIDPPRRDGRFTWEDHRPSLGWIKLTHVCRRLRQLGLNYSSLWARIVCILPNACDTVLERSRNTPLTLNLRPLQSLDYFKILPIFDILPRARHITDQPSDDDPPNRKLWWTVSSLANLEYCKISSGWPNLSGDLGHIISPALQTYIVVDVFIPFTAPSLRSLSIYHPLPWTELLDVLRSCPLLTSLSIRKAMAVDSTVVHSSRHPVVSLPHLKDFLIDTPDECGTLDLLEHIAFPCSVNFKSYLFEHEPSLLHALLAYPRLEHSARDTLSITTSCGTDGGESRFHLFLSESHDRPFSEYGTPPGGGLRFETILDDDDEMQLANALFHLSPTTAQSIRVLAFYSGQTFVESFGETESYKENWQDPLAVSGEGFTNLWRAVCAFTKVETVYFSDVTEPSMSLLKLHPEWGSDKNQDESRGAKAKLCMAFPNLSTVVLDTRCKRMRINEWSSLLDIIETRRANGRPIERVVLMGSHLCHIIMGKGKRLTAIADGYEEVWTELPLQEPSWEHLRSVVQVVDLRHQGCRCGERDAPMRIALPAQPDEFD